MFEGILTFLFNRQETLYKSYTDSTWISLAPLLFPLGLHNLSTPGVDLGLNPRILQHKYQKARPFEAKILDIF